MERQQIYKCYALSLLWTSMLFGLALAVSTIVELVFVDFVHGNPHRTQANAVEMMWWGTPIISVIAIAGCLLVFSIPQLLQAIVHSLSPKRSRFRPTLLVIGFLPITSILTWYCWEYLTPTNVSFGDSDWEPYQHGITLARYIGALEFQVPVTIFSILYSDPGIIGTSRRYILLSAVIFSLIAGVVHGHILAEHQYRFLV